MPALLFRFAMPFGVLALLLVAGCTSSPDAPPGDPAPDASPPADSLHPDWGAFFERYGGVGTVVVLDARTGRRHVYEPERAAERFVPASTFKVYNSLVALETGVVPDVDSVFAWDGVDRGIEAWNRDHSIRTGIAASAVWLYQELARRIGAEGYREAFAREPYGNNTVGDSVTTFWLGQALAISADEQVVFLDRLRRGDLAFRPEVQAAVREILLLEETEAYRLYGKTGWAWDGAERANEIGWIVGWIERGDEAWVYALNVEPARDGFDMQAARLGLLHAVLADLGLRPTETGP